MDSPVVQVLKSAMQLGAPDPVLSAHVKKSHLEAGKALVGETCVLFIVWLSFCL
jgi:hypothetical protein